MELKPINKQFSSLQNIINFVKDGIITFEKNGMLQNVKIEIIKDAYILKENQTFKNTNYGCSFENDNQERKNNQPTHKELPAGTRVRIKIAHYWSTRGYYAILTMYHDRKFECSFTTQMTEDEYKEYLSDVKTKFLPENTTFNCIGIAYGRIKNSVMTLTK